MKSNPYEQRLYYAGFDCIKKAVNADNTSSHQLAITLYTEGIKNLRKALFGQQLTESEKSNAQQTIDRATNRIRELQQGIISTNPLPSQAKQTPQHFSSSISTSKSQPPTQQSSQQQQELSMDHAIVHQTSSVTFKDVAGLSAAKQALSEAVLLPIKFPALFKGPVQPWKGILLYGPPGTGKSFLAKAIAGEANNITFTTVSPAELTSKWVGESEKLVSGLFAAARAHRPSIIFIDEIDSLVSARDSNNNESESGRRIKTEFLIQLDGVKSDNTGILFIAATNFPWALDPAIRRRFEKRIYVPLPDKEAREVLIKQKLHDASYDLSQRDINQLVNDTEGFSGADLTILIRDALMQPIRELQSANSWCQTRGIDMNGVLRDGLWVPCAKNKPGANHCTWEQLPQEDIMRPVSTMNHFKASLKKIKPSVSQKDLANYQRWTAEFGEDGT